MCQDHQTTRFQKAEGERRRLFERVHCLEMKAEATHLNGLRLPDWGTIGAQLVVMSPLHAALLANW